MKVSSSLNQKPEILLVLTTCKQSEAEKLSCGLVETGLVACVNQISGVSSTFRWQQKIQTDLESVLLIKTTVSVYDELRTWLKHNHPYELPEILVVPVIGGSSEYLDWVTESVTGTR